MNYSTTFFLLASLAAFQFVYGEDDYIKGVANAAVKCKENSPLSKDYIELLVYSPKRLRTREEKCVMRCILEDVGLIKGNAYDWEFHLSHSKRANLEKTINNCKGIENDDSCELAGALMACFAKQAKGHPERWDEYDNAAEKCLKNTMITWEAAMEIIYLSGPIKNQEEKCLIGCVLEEVGIIKGNTHDVDYHASLLDLELEKKMARECKPKDNEDKCELGYEILSCIAEERKKLKASNQETKH